MFIIQNMRSPKKSSPSASLVRDVALVCVAVAIVGASFGAICVSGGLPLWVPVAMSLLIFAGAAQFAAVGVVLSGGAPLVGVLAGLLLNTRLIPYSFTVRTLIRGPWWKQLLGAHLTMDEAVAFAMGQSAPALKRRAFWLCGLCLFAAWNAAVVLGAAAGDAVGDTDRLGLDAMFPAVLLALVLPSLRARRLRYAASLGAALALCATPFLPSGLPVLVSLAGLLLTPVSPSESSDISSGESS